MKITRLISISITFIIASLIVISCDNLSRKQDSSSEVINNGVIEYAVNFPKGLENSSNFLLPQNATLRFNKENLRMTFSTMFNIVTFEFLKQVQSDTTYILLETLGMKAYSSLSINQFLTNGADFNIETKVLKDSVKYFNNQRCNKALLYSEFSQSPIATVWFATDLPTKNPYQGTYLSDIPGIIISLDGKFNGQNFSINTKSIFENPKPENWSTISTNEYRYVEKEDIMQKAWSLFNQ